MERIYHQLEDVTETNVKLNREAWDLWWNQEQQECDSIP